MAVFKDMLKYLRNNENLSQSELAEKLGVAKSTISMYEVGKREPDFETLESIADFFNVDMNFLLGKEYPENKEAALTLNNKKDIETKLEFVMNNSSIDALMNNRLYERRKELGLTLEQVGDICGVGKSTVRKWENGIINNMRRDNIVSLAKALQVSPMFILQSESTERVLSKFDNKILKLCDLLNILGQGEALKRVEELTYISKYTDSDYLLPVAAHTDDTSPENIKAMETEFDDFDELP